MAQTAKCVEHFKSRYNMELEFLEKLFRDVDADLLSRLYHGLIKLSNNISVMEEQYNQNEEQ